MNKLRLKKDQINHIQTKYIILEMFIYLKVKSNL